MAINAVTLRGTPAYTAGKFGNALSGGVLGVPSALASQFPAQAAANPVAITGAFTLEAWIKCSTVGGIRVAVGFESNVWLGLSAGGVPTFSMGATPTALIALGTARIDDGAWHHLAGTFDGTSQASIYVDGVRVGQATGSPARRTAPNYEGITIGGFGNTATFDWAGQIDEAAFSDIVQYSGASFIPPVSAFAPSRPGQRNLYSLEAGGTDSDVADVAPPVVGTITTTTAGGTDTISYPAPTAGANAIASVSLYVGTSSGGQSGTAYATNSGAGAGSFTHPTASSGSNYYYIRAVDTAGIYSSASNEVVAPPPTAIPPTSAGYLYSPGTWDVQTARALSVTEGSRIETVVLGAPTSIAMLFDVANLPSAGQRTTCSYRINQGNWTDFEPAASVSVAIPAGQQSWPKHNLEIIVKASSTVPNRWDSPFVTGVKFLGLLMPNGATIAAPLARELRGLALGDSITGGISTLGSTGDETTRSDGRLGWAYQLRDNLGAEVGVVGFGGLGMVRPYSSVPGMKDSWDFIVNGVARSFAGLDFVVINIGTNDQRNAITAAAFTTAYTAMLNELAAVVSPTTKIIVLVPFGQQYGATVYQNVVAATTSPKRFNLVLTAGWWNTADSFDTLHPSAWANKSNLGPKVATAIRAALNAGGQWINAGGVAKRVSAARN